MPLHRFVQFRISHLFANLVKNLSFSFIFNSYRVLEFFAFNITVISVKLFLALSNSVSGIKISPSLWLNY